MNLKLDECKCRFQCQSYFKWPMLTNADIDGHRTCAQLKTEEQTFADAFDNIWYKARAGNLYSFTLSYAQLESCRQQSSMILQCVGAQCQLDGTCGKKTSTVGRTCKKNTSCQKKSGYSDGICIRHEVTRVKKCLCPPDKAGSKCDLLPSTNGPESHYVSSKAIAFFFR